MTYMKEYWELIKKLKEIKKMGYIKTHRIGNTGIGKTLEDLLEIDENNIPGPNAKMIELKSARKNAKSMLTLFTKSPLPRKANPDLVRTYGYPSKSGNNTKELHTTINALSFNTVKERIGFKIIVKDNRVEIMVKVSKKEKIVGFWDKKTLKDTFERKLPKLLYVKADCKGSDINEKFWFNEAWLLSGFDFDNFVKLLKDGKIKVDIRIGQYPDGRTHDHGTGFRVFPDKLDLCFSHREKVI